MVIKNNFTDPSESFIFLKIIPTIRMSQFEIHLNIKKDAKEGLLGIGEIATVLKGLQDAIYDIAESSIIQRKSFRIRGKRDGSLEKRTKLTFKTVGAGSFHSTIVGEPIEAIEGITIVDESIEIFGTISNNLNESKEVKEAEPLIKDLIPDPLYRSRVMNDIAGFWPGQENRYKLQLETQNFKRNHLKAERRVAIKSLASLERKEIRETTMGVMGGGHFIKNKMFEIEGPDGTIKCQYTKDLHETVLKFLTKPVIVEGLLTTTAGKPRKVPKVFSIKPLEKIPLSRIITEKGELKLKESIDIIVAFKEDVWVFEYPELNIISCGDTYNETIGSFQEDFIELFEHYALSDPEKMTGNALKIRAVFKRLVAQ